MANYFVTAIGTDSGKTLVSAILTEALNADYWKPVQAGLEERDTYQVQKLISNSQTTFYPEAYALNTPMSPHQSAKIDGIEVKLSEINLPKTQNNNLIVEGAGGVLVPINDTDFVIDIAAKFKCEIILVSNLYLGSINHTILTINEIKRRGLKVKGIIFNGESNPSSEEFILKYSNYPCLLKISKETEITKEIIVKYAKQISLLV